MMMDCVTFCFCGVFMQKTTSIMLTCAPTNVCFHGLKMISYSETFNGQLGKHALFVVHGLKHVFDLFNLCLHSVL